jgi:hypothetical protein
LQSARFGTKLPQTTRFNPLRKRYEEAITLAFCWAHLRRRFFDIAQGGPAPIASEALARIAALYAIEKTIRGRSAAERHAVRQEKSKPLVLALKAWLERQLARVSAKATIAEDIRYGLNHWEGLTRLCIPSSSVCKHWNRVVVSDATRATFSGYRRFDRFRCQVVGPNLVWRAGHNLHRGQHAGFDQAAYRACDA